MLSSSLKEKSVDTGILKQIRNIDYTKLWSQTKSITSKAINATLDFKLRDVIDASTPPIVQTAEKLKEGVTVTKDATKFVAKKAS